MKKLLALLLAVAMVLSFAGQQHLLFLTKQDI